MTRPSEFSEQLRRELTVKSPESLDQEILAFSRQHTPERSVDLRFSPWLTAMATCSVAALAILIVIRAPQESEPLSVPLADFPGETQPLMTATGDQDKSRVHIPTSMNESRQLTLASTTSAQLESDAIDNLEQVPAQKKQPIEEMVVVGNLQEQQSLSTASDSTEMTFVSQPADYASRAKDLDLIQAPVKFIEYEPDRKESALAFVRPDKRDMQTETTISPTTSSDPPSSRRIASAESARPIVNKLTAPRRKASRIEDLIAFEQIAATGNQSSSKIESAVAGIGNDITTLPEKPQSIDVDAELDKLKKLLRQEQPQQAKAAYQKLREQCAQCDLPETLDLALEQLEKRRASR